MNFYALCIALREIGRIEALDWNRPTKTFVFGMLDKHGEQTWMLLTQDEMTRYLAHALCGFQVNGTVPSQRAFALRSVQPVKIAHNHTPDLLEQMQRSREIMDRYLQSAHSEFVREWAAAVEERERKRLDDE